jgi:hypothetical protein
MAAEHPNEYPEGLVYSLARMAFALNAMSRFEDTYKAAMKTSELYHPIARVGLNHHKINLACTYSEMILASSHLDHADHEFSITEETVQIYMELRVPHPDRFGPKMAFVLTRMAIHLNQATQYAKTCGPALLLLTRKTP